MHAYLIWSRLALALALVCTFGGVASLAVQAKDQSKHNKPPLDDSKLNCKQLSGRIQVLILQARSYDPGKQSSGLSRSLQSAFVTTFGNNPHGADPEGTHTGELKTMQNYNQRLVSLGCKSYDLDAELQKHDPDETPAATIPAPKRPKVPTAQGPSQ